MHCQEVDADTCGIWGDQLLLKLLGISSASEDFNQKARFHSGDQRRDFTFFTGFRHFKSIHRFLKIGAGHEPVSSHNYVLQVLQAARLVLKYHQQNFSNCFRGDAWLHLTLQFTANQAFGYGSRDQIEGLFFVFQI